MNFSASDITTLQAVAGFFGSQLLLDDGGYCCRIAVCEAFSLFIRKDYATKKARFTAILPEEVSRTDSVDGVNVSLQRPALAIAKDIQRRLIPAATQWAQKCRDSTAKLKREKQAEGEFIARIFTANRSEPTRSSHDGWRGKGLQIGRYDAQRSAGSDYAATVRVRSIQALEQIAAICAADWEFHQQATATKGKS